MNESIASLLAKAQIIYDETAPAANTHQRIGQMFIDIINLLGTKMPSTLCNPRSTYTMPNMQLQRQSGASAIVATAVRYYPILVTQDIEVSSLSVELTSTGASTCYIALHYDTGVGFPGAIHTDFPQTTIVTTSVGVKSITPASPVVIPCGLYWLAHYCNATLSWRNSSSNSQMRFFPSDPNAPTASLADSNYFVSGAVGSLPDPAPSPMSAQTVENILAWFTFA